MNESRTRALAGLLRTPAAEAEDVAVTLRWTEDQLTLELSSGDIITAGRERLTSAVIWMRGAVTGTWAVPGLAAISTLAVLADDDVTRIASGDRRRSSQTHNNAMTRAGRTSLSVTCVQLR
jgi:hypothetical protein